MMTEGLIDSDFPSKQVDILFADGTTVAHRRAFILRDVCLPNRVAVFSKNEGHHEYAFSLGDVLRISPSALDTPRHCHGQQHPADDSRQD